MTADKAYFKDLFDENHAKVYRFAFNRLKNKQDAQDATQQVFIKIWSNKSYIQKRAVNNRLLFTIVRNTIIDFHKKQIFTEDLDTVFQIRNEVIPEDGLQQQIAFLSKSIQNLPPKRREIFQLTKQQGLTYQETADHLNISKKTVENQVSLATKSLRKVMMNMFSL